ncbi:hypothetical protein SLS56_011440 [Neofusicoccum ribis]|uniref:Dihydrodipicolinate synthetase family protein n=1 Tax=Neofusicoccum ribis TaxID=45134 RepID=A0ABR3SBN0_9PEZI
MAPRVPPDGVFVPVPTFFKPASGATLQPAVDVETQVAHSVHLARSGIRGLVLLGSTGEAIHLSRTERHDFLRGVRDGLTAAGFPDYPIMAGVLTNSVDEVLEWLDDSAKAGSQWGLVLAPGYFGAAASQDNLVEWYTAVADRSPIPILIYNYPGVTNNLIVAPETSHGNVSHHVQMSLHPQIDSKTFRVYSGFGQQLGPIVLFGAAGVIDGLAAIYPKTVAHLFELAAKRPVEDATLKEVQDLQFRVSAAEEFIGKNGILGIREGIYRVLGMGNLEGGRLPLRGKIAEGEWEKWAVATGAMAEVETRIK